MPLTDTERAFLDQPGYARLATLMPDGSPQMTVLWYRRVDDELHVVCPESAQKVRNIDRDNRVSVVVEDPESAHRYLELRGRAEVVRDDALARRELVPIARRYIGNLAEAHAARLSAEPRVLLVIRPWRVIHRGTG